MFLSKKHLFFVIAATLSSVMGIVHFTRPRSNLDHLKYAHQSSPTASTDGAENVQQRIKGCDVSYWDGEIDWVALKKSEIKFLFIKATQGTTYIDPLFEENWTTADNYGFYKGAYHFYQPHEDPKVQAEHFLSVVKHEKGDLVPVLDIEISDGADSEELTEGISVWINTVKEAIGRFPIIYTDRAFWNKAINEDFSHCPLWIAEWEHGHDPYLPNGWKDWVFWQFSETGSVAGIPHAEQKTDLNYFKGGAQAFKNYQVR